MSLILHLFVSDVNQGNKDFDCKKVDSRFSCVAPEMVFRKLLKRFALKVGWNF